MNDKLRAYLYLHISVLFWGITAILGKLLTIQAIPLVWWRVLLCSATLLLIIPNARLYKNIKRGQFIQMLKIGGIVGLHWVCFYGAIKLSNASVAVTTMATASLFSALINPLIARQRINWRELMLSGMILPGMALVIGSIDWEMRLGLAVGVLGAALAALFTAMNKKLVDSHMAPSPISISFVELLGGLIVTSLVMPVLLGFEPQTAWIPTMRDWIWLLILCWACTLWPNYLTLLALKRLSAFSVNLTINLEPVYGVLLAGVIFREDKDLTPEFYLGVVIILAAVFSHPFLKKKSCLN